MEIIAASYNRYSQVARLHSAGGAVALLNSAGSWLYLQIYQSLDSLAAGRRELLKSRKR
jgi:hypothetical protein